MKKVLKIVITVLSLILIIVGTYVAYAYLISSGYEQLQKYSEQNNYEGVQNLLRWGVPPSPTNTIMDFSYFSALTDTPLHNAAANGNYKMAKLLIDDGAVVDWCCCSCVTPLHLAIINKHADVVKLLLSSGANTQKGYDLTYTVIELAQLKSTPEIQELVKAHNKNEEQILIRKRINIAHFKYYAATESGKL